MLRLLGWLLLLSCACLAEGLSGPVGIVLGPGGRLVIAEAGRGRVVRDDGRVLAEGLDPWGLVRIGDEIACSEPSRGTLTWLEGGQLLGGLDRPTGMAWSPDTRLLYVVERGGRLLEVDPFAGEIRRVVTDQLPGAEGIDCSRVQAFVTQPLCDRVSVVDLASGAVRLLADDIELPTGIVLGDAVVFVESAASGQVLELDLEHPERRRVMAETGAPGLAGLLLAPEPPWTGPGLQLGPFTLGLSPYGPPNPVTGLPPYQSPPIPGKLTLIATNVVDGSVTQTRLSDDPHPRAVLEPALRPAGSLRYELESRLFAAGFTEAELDPTGRLVHAPLLRSLYSDEPVRGIVDSALDGEGNVYYALSEGGRVVSGSGSSLLTVAEGLDDAGGLAVDNQGVIFVCEVGAGRVSTVLGGGELLPVGTDLGRPLDLAFLPGLGLAVVDEGGRLFLLGAEGAVTLRSDLQRPVAIARLPDGDLAVVEAGADRVVRLAPDGTLRKVLLTCDPGELVPPAMPWRVLGGLAADPLSGLLYVAVPGRARWVAVPY